MAISTLVIAGVACQVIAGIDERTSGPVAPPGPACGPRWPDLPAQSDPGLHNIGFLTAVRTLDLGFVHQDAAVPAVGFDLDCDSFDAGSCVPHPGANLVNTESNGADNGIAALLDGIATALTDEAGADFNLNQHIARGEIGLLIQVGGYNGGANDAHVDHVFAWVSDGIYGTAEAGAPDGGLDAGPPGPIRPTWNGQDTWSIDPGSAVGGAEVPRFVSSMAYVNGHVLVAFFDVMQVPASIGPGTGVFTLEHVVLTARITLQSSGAYGLDDGQIGARISTRTVLSSLAQFKDPFDPDAGSLCGTDVTYQFAKSQYVCAAADINDDPAHDNAGLGCNALSAAIGFQAFPALLGDTRPRAVASGCSGADGSAFTDDCPSDNGDY